MFSASAGSPSSTQSVPQPDLSPASTSRKYNVLEIHCPNLRDTGIYIYIWHVLVSFVKGAGVRMVLKRGTVRNKCAQRSEVHLGQGRAGGGNFGDFCRPLGPHMALVPESSTTEKFFVRSPGPYV